MDTIKYTLWCKCGRQREIKNIKDFLIKCECGHQAKPDDVVKLEAEITLTNLLSTEEDE